MCFSAQGRERPRRRRLRRHSTRSVTINPAPTERGCSELLTPVRTVTKEVPKFSADATEFMDTSVVANNEPSERSRRSDCSTSGSPWAVPRALRFEVATTIRAYQRRGRDSNPRAALAITLGGTRLCTLTRKCGSNWFGSLSPLLLVSRRVECSWGRFGQRAGSSVASTIRSDPNCCTPRRSRGLHGLGPDF